MSKFTPEIPPALEDAILECLTTDESIQEYALLKHLSSAGFQGFEPSLDELLMFQAHFLLGAVLDN